jgi:hypothetical protein
MKKADVLFWSIISAVLIIQGSGLGFGLPRQYHPDEYYININTFNLFHELRDFNFEKTRYALGIRWLYFAEYVGAFAVGKISGVFHTFAEFHMLYFSYGNPYVDAAPPLFYLLPRITSFLFYAGCVVLLWLLVKKFSNSPHLPKIAVFAALFLPAGYLYGHYGTRESALCFFSLLLLWHAYFFFDPTRLKQIFIGGILLGVAAGIKENAAIFVALYCYFIVAAFFKKELPLPRFISYGIIIVTVFIAVFFLVNPQRWMINNVAEVTKYYSETQEKTATVGSLNDHLIYPRAFIREFSLPGLILLIMGLIAAWFLKKDLRPLICIILGAYLALDLFKANGLNKADRFIMFIYLPFLVVGMCGLDRVVQTVKSEKILWLFPLIVCVFNAKELVSIFAVLNGHDTRVEAGVWMTEHLPKKSRIAREIIYSPAVDPQTFAIVKAEWTIGRYSLDSLKKSGIDYLVFSDVFSSGWYHGDAVTGNYKSFLPYTIKTFEPRFRPTTNNFHSPKIFVCKIQ